MERSLLSSRMPGNHWRVRLNNTRQCIKNVAILGTMDTLSDYKYNSAS